MRTMAVDEGLVGLIEAARREPVILQRQERDVAVVLSMTEYERLTRRNVEAPEKPVAQEALGRANAAQCALLDETRGLWSQGDGLAWQRALRDEWRD